MYGYLFIFMYMLYMMAFVETPVNPGSHCNSGGPPPPASQKAIDIYPICDDRRPGYYIISVPYPGFNHSNENYRNYLFLARVYDLGLLVHFP